MRLLCLAWLFFLVSIGGTAQTLDEWLKPKKTQIDYLIKQIAAWRGLTGAIKESTGIIGSGLTGIGDSRESEFQSHEDFFQSLRVSGELSEKAYGEMLERGLHPLQVKSLILDSRSYWMAVSLEDSPAFSQWSSGIHQGMLDQVMAQEYWLETLGSDTALMMEGAERARLLEGILFRMARLKRDLLLLQEKSHKYLIMYGLKLSK